MLSMVDICCHKYKFKKMVHFEGYWGGKGRKHVLIDHVRRRSGIS